MTDTPQQAKQLQIPPQIWGYLDSLLLDAGMQILDEAMHEEMIKELFVRLDSYITAVIIDQMPSDHLEPFVKLHEDNKPQAEIDQYIKDHLPNAQQALTQAFINFREEYLGGVAAGRNKPMIVDNKT